MLSRIKIQNEAQIQDGHQNKRLILKFCRKIKTILKNPLKTYKSSKILNNSEKFTRTPILPFTNKNQKHQKI
jgi:hypothetical protein